MTPDLWVLGNLTIDDVVLPDGRTSMGMCGGNAIYAALGGRMWSDGVGLSARIGPDFLKSNVDALVKVGIQLDLVPVPVPSIHNWALYESPDQRQFVMRLDSGTHLQQSLLPEEVAGRAATARICHVAPMPLQRQMALVRHFAAGPGLVSLDPHDEYIMGAESEYTSLLRLVDLFLPSRKEAALLYGRDDPIAAARAFANAGPSVVAIKLGSEGSIVLGPGLDEPIAVPALAVRSVDPTGAGDAYCGAFGVTYAQTRDPLESALRATVAGALTVRQCGALAVLPFRPSALQEHLEHLRSEIEQHAHGKPRAEVGQHAGGHQRPARLPA